MTIFLPQLSLFHFPLWMHSLPPHQHQETYNTTTTWQLGNNDNNSGKCSPLHYYNPSDHSHGKNIYSDGDRRGFHYSFISKLDYFTWRGEYIERKNCARLLGIMNVVCLVAPIIAIFSSFAQSVLLELCVWWLIKMWTHFATLSTLEYMHT